MTGVVEPIWTHRQCLKKYSSPAKYTRPIAKKIWITIPAHILFVGPTNSTPVRK